MIFTMGTAEMAMAVTDRKIAHDMLNEFPRSQPLTISVNGREEKVHDVPLAHQRLEQLIREADD